jgi:hypothetical protein
MKGADYADSDSTKESKGSHEKGNCSSIIKRHFFDSNSN